MTFWRISLNNLTFGIEVENERVTRTAPVAKWALGRNFRIVKDYYEKINATVKEVDLTKEECALN